MKNAQPFPSNLLLERKVIEGLVNLEADFAEALELSADCFYDRTHQRVFEICKALQSQKRPADQVLVLEQLGDDPDARPFVASLGFPPSQNLGAWCEQLRALRTLRKTIEAGLRLAALGFESADDPSAYLDQASKMFAEALNTRSCNAQIQPMDSIMGEVMEDLRSKEANAATRILSTGFFQLDHALGGLEPGRVYVVAGRTGMGKSALANQIAMLVSSMGHRVLAFNLEMTPKEVGRRMVSVAAGVDGRALKRGKLSELEAKRATRSAEKIAGFPLEYPRTTDITIEELRRTARSRMSDGLRLVVVDYLQQVKTAEHLESREQSVAAVSRGLKQMALELEIPVIAVAQLNRDSEKRASQKPGLADLRESGAIENDADVVCLLYRDEYYNQQTKEPGTCDVIVAKNRDGETGVSKMLFEKQFTRFKDRITSEASHG
jgi:replicative DNA helicase